MQQVILFGADDGGGVVITEKGVIRIPPWNPTTQRILEAVSALSHTLPHLKEAGLGDEASKLMDGMWGLMRKVLETAAGPLNKDASMVHVGNLAATSADGGKSGGVR